MHAHPENRRRRFVKKGTAGMVQEVVRNTVVLLFAFTLGVVCTISIIYFYPEEFGEQTGIWTHHSYSKNGQQSCEAAKQNTCSKEKETYLEKENNIILTELVECKTTRDEYKYGQKKCKKDKAELEKEKIEVKSKQEKCIEDNVNVEKEREKYKSGQEKYKMELDECNREKFKLQNTHKKESTGDFEKITTLEDNWGVCTTQKIELTKLNENCKRENKQLQKDTRELERKVDALKSADQARKESAVVMIIGSITPPPLTGWWVFQTPDKDVVPMMSPQSLTYQEHKLLTERGVPIKKRNNGHVLLSLYNKAAKVFSVELSKPGLELSRAYLLNKIELLFTSTNEKTPVTLHFYGNCQRNTGNWYLKDSYITFHDIGSIYKKYGRHRHLTIVSDCHSAGAWLDSSKQFLLNEVGHCWNWKETKGLFIKVHASAMIGQDATELLFTIKAMPMVQGTIKYSETEKLRTGQQAIFADYTKGLCDGTEYGVKKGKK